MYTGILSYFAQLQAGHQLSALSSKARTGLLAAKGIFGYEPKVDYLFGLPRSISSGGIHLDIEITRVVRSLDNDNQKTIDFAIQTGPIGSALEHALKEVPLGCQVPEQMFNTDPNNPTQAISTVKALQLANAQGQQIYKIDNTNIDEVLPKLNLSNSVKQDIQSSVNVGKYVITHTDNVSVPGWSGAGYAIIDPTTGSDAYLISGGTNGAFATIATFSGMFSLFSARNADVANFFKLGNIAGLFKFIGQQLFVLSYVAGASSIALECNQSVLSLITMMAFHMIAYIALAAMLFISVTTPVGIAALFLGSAGAGFAVTIAESYLQEWICK